MEDHLASLWMEGIRHDSPGSLVGRHGYGNFDGYYNDSDTITSRSLQEQMNRGTIISDSIQMIICLSMYGVFL